MAKNNPKKRTKFKLGKKTSEGYEYSAKIDFKEDLSTQIANLIKEKRVNEALELEIKKLRKKLKKNSGRKREKNLQYYYFVGKNLLFLDKKTFQEISPFSILRRIAEEIPEILPHIKEKRRRDHLMAMYRLGHIDKRRLGRVSWGQWYEITKFKGIHKRLGILEEILNECKSGVSGPPLRAKIKNLLTKKGKK